MNNSPTYDGDQEQTETQCSHCGELVDINSTDIFKSVSDRFYHKDCFAEYCYESRELVATPEGSFKILPVVIKEIENGKERVIDSYWRAECPVCHRTHETDEKSEDVRTDFIDTVTSCCDTEWLPPADWIEDCEICGTSHRESRDCKPLSRREPFPDPDEHTYDCSKCGWSGKGDEFDNPDGYCPECDSAAVRALKVATDGGRDVQNSPTDDGDDGGVSRSSPIEPRGDEYPEQPGGDGVTVRLSAFQNDLLIDLIEENRDRIHANFDPVYDDILDKLDMHGRNTRPPVASRLNDTDYWPFEVSFDD